MLHLIRESRPLRLAVTAVLLSSTAIVSACSPQSGSSEEVRSDDQEIVTQRTATVEADSNATAGVAAMEPMIAPYPAPSPMPGDEVRDQFEDVEINGVKVVAEEPVSTFSADVDTASYAVIRNYLNSGALPPRDAVRPEEMINYFDYTYRLPETRERPFEPNITVMQTPWNAGTQLVHIGIQGFDVPRAERPAANLVLLLDVSGSMDDPKKLPLLKNALRLMIDQLTGDDTVSIVVYAGAAGTVLEPTPGDQKARILGALDSLSAGGSTAGGEGIRLAYQLAEQTFKPDGINRVILATDGDFNVGITDPEQLEDFVARKRESGVTLTVLGFGQGNYNDALMQKLAQSGNGNAAYIDTLNEARKVLVNEMAGTLFTIAGDVKFQIEFNPQRVAEYRLIGYETRLLNREDFNNDAVDAGDIGSGHRVTAIYEIVPVGSEARLTDPLRYQTDGVPPPHASGSEIAFLKVRYKLPGEETSKLIERPITDRDVVGEVARAPEDVRFGVSVAAFAQALRGDPYLSGFGYDAIASLARGARGEDRFGYRSEFIQLVELAKSLPALPPLETHGTGN